MLCCILLRLLLPALKKRSWRVDSCLLYATLICMKDIFYLPPNWEAVSSKRVKGCSGKSLNTLCKLHLVRNVAVVLISCGPLALTTHAGNKIENCWLCSCTKQLPSSLSLRLQVEFFPKERSLLRGCSLCQKRKAAIRAPDATCKTLEHKTASYLLG